VAPTPDDSRSRLEHVLRDVFDDESIVADPALQREDVPQWDSLGHIRLVSAIEEEFRVSFTIEQIEAITSVARILEALDAQG
jgi:acyl carrier protein